MVDFRNVTIAPSVIYEGEFNKQGVNVVFNEMVKGLKKGSHIYCDGRQYHSWVEYVDNYRDFNYIVIWQ